MTYTPPNINSFWGTLIIDELIRNRIDYFCISPGSRSTPLTIAAARNKSARINVCYDERGAAYHALGFARAANKPAVLIATSGTAAANFYPAVIEASLDRIPMIVLTADRPPELRSAGANQTIDQVKMYGGYVRWDFDMPCPDEKIPPGMVLTTIDQAVSLSLTSPRGPVHINCMFREPLAPSKESIGKNYLDPLKGWLKHQKPYTTVTNSRALPDEHDIERLSKILNSSKKGLLIIGRLESQNDRNAVDELIEKLDFPVFADILSGIRTDSKNKNVIHYFDQLLLSLKFYRDTAPDCILHIGGQMTSKRFLQYVENLQDTAYIVVKDHPFRHDPIHKVTMRIESSIAGLCTKLSAMIKSRNAGAWLQSFNDASGKVNIVIEQFLSEHKTISEPAIARVISQLIPDGDGLYLASSMPVRDMDMYAGSSAKKISIDSNRGASGIDGTIASAAGFAVGLDKRVTLIMGDLAFMHDMNSLALLDTISQPLIIIIVNNKGGGIFSFLPISGFKDVFEKYFAAAHNYSFGKIAEHFQFHYGSPSTIKEFEENYLSALNNKRSTVIELKTDRAENLTLHSKLQDIIKEAL